eukprot:snap_masked-scaffold_21-processed-gene-2.20-mRNA-1 protein AED:0.02 eAED:0.03 QI:0/-1/0/1/-1/1/1/0/606
MKFVQKVKSLSSFYLNKIHPKTFSTKTKSNLFAVIKVGGDIIESEKSLQNLTKTIQTLNSQSLSSIIIHGGGPQLNNKLKELNIEPEYINGSRVTNLEIMKLATETFKNVNSKLVSQDISLFEPFTSGVLTAKKSNEYVGEITDINVENIVKSLEKGKVPVICSLAENSEYNGDSKYLNINADVITKEISLNLKPEKTIFISAKGGWTENDKIVSKINLTKRYKKLVSQNYTGRQGTKMKLMEIKNILNKLPLSSTVSICSSEDLEDALFGEKESFSTFYMTRKIMNVGLIGARGYTGKEILDLIDKSDELELVLASSRQLNTQKVANFDLEYVELQPNEIVEKTHELDVDCWILALPNGLSDNFSKPLKEAHFEKKVVLLDLSADNRFDESWIYGLIEGYDTRKKLSEQSSGLVKISNPGCYATGMQLGILPLLKYIKADYKPVVFGVSGYSGAGTTPSKYNDTQFLKDNLVAYKKIGHIHEKECSRHLKKEISFIPHVSSWFQGIHLTINLYLEKNSSGIYPSKEEIINIFKEFYRNEPLIKISEDLSVKQVQGENFVMIGDFEVCEETGRIVFISLIDNLLKGAAVQAIQNINISLGIEEFKV